MQSVLIVDGCPLTRECLSMLLRAKGYRAFTAADSATAKAHIAKRPPDAMISELVLPDGSALGLLRWLVDDQRGARTKVCVLTQVAAKKPLTEAVEIGVSAVMLKSRFTIKGLLVQIESLLKHPDETGASKDKQEPVRFPLPMPAPDPAEALRKHKPLINRPGLEALLEQCEQPVASAAVSQRVRSMMGAEVPEIEAIASVLRGDPVLTGIVLRAANATDNGCEEPAAGVFEALLRVGLDRLLEILDETPTDSARELGSECGLSISADHMRAHALGVGIVASRIASLCEGIDERSAMTAGLLHDYARMRMLDAMGDELMEAMVTSAGVGVALRAGERRLLLCEHEQLGQTMMGAWNLPREVIDAIAHHHAEPGKISSLCPRNARLVALVALADRIAHGLGLGGSGSCAIEPSEELFSSLAQEDLTLGPIVEGIRDDYERALNASGIDASSMTWSGNQAVPGHTVRPIYISSDPELDVYAHWIERQFGELSGGESPNMAIVHMRQPKSRADLGVAVAVAQARLSPDEQRHPLPVLILSPSGRNGLSEDLMTRHPCMHLRTPFTASHFERACDNLLDGKLNQESLSDPSCAHAA